MELWPDIHAKQKKLPGYKKSKERFKRSFDDGLGILDYDKETEKLIEGKGLKGKKAIEFKNRRLYEYVDENYYSKDEQESPEFKDEKKILKNRRKRKSRIKTFVGPN